MRVFVAINPSAEMRARLAEASRRLREGGYPVRWVPPDNVHVTLKFLGEIADGRVEEVCSAADAAVGEAAAFELAVGGFGAFPTLRRPRVLWTGIGRSEKLEMLHARAEDGLAELGYPREDRAFRPHLTIGRAQKHARPNEFNGLDELVEKLEYDDVFQVRSVDVMRSRLMPSGALYDVIHSAELEL
jgi:2'-5' RNA ligase